MLTLCPAGHQHTGTAWLGLTELGCLIASIVGRHQVERGPTSGDCVQGRRMSVVLSKPRYGSRTFKRRTVADRTWEVVVCFAQPSGVGAVDRGYVVLSASALAAGTRAIQHTRWMSSSAITGSGSGAGAGRSPSSRTSARTPRLGRRRPGRSRATSGTTAGSARRTAPRWRQWRHRPPLGSSRRRRGLPEECRGVSHRLRDRRLEVRGSSPPFHDW